VNLQFTTPAEVGRRSYAIYVISDCYLGLDQQYEFVFDIIASSIEAQTNGELSFD